MGRGKRPAERKDTMKIPKFVQEIMERSKFALGEGDPGYTIEVRKETPYTYADTFQREIERLVAWANRVVPHIEDVPNAIINRVPTKTRHEFQYATVTIYDPIMQQIEKYIAG